MALFSISLVAAGLAIGWGLNRHVETSAADFVFEDHSDITPRTVAIVLGARVYSDGAPSAALEDRLHCALELYRSGKTSRILVSGDHGQREYDEVNSMHAWLVGRGVDVDHIFLDHAGFRTFDTMERAARVFQVEDAIVCTQRFHQHRSVFLARRAGIDAVGLVADRRIYPAARTDARREALARVGATFDSYLPFRSPRHLGDPIPIDGSPQLSHDRWTAGSLKE